MLGHLKSFLETFRSSAFQRGDTAELQQHKYRVTPGVIPVNYGPGGLIQVPASHAATRSDTASPGS